MTSALFTQEARISSDDLLRQFERVLNETHEKVLEALERLDADSEGKESEVDEAYREGQGPTAEKKRMDV